MALIMDSMGPWSVARYKPLMKNSLPEACCSGGFEKGGVSKKRWQQGCGRPLGAREEREGGEPPEGSKQ